MNTALVDRVREWMMQEGYPFEMSVSKILSSCGIGHHCGRYWRDSETNKLLESDIVAYKEQPASVDVPGMSAGINLMIIYLIECKVLSKPWVFLKSERNNCYLQWLSHWPSNEKYDSMWIPICNQYKDEIRKMDFPQCPVYHGITTALRPDKANNEGGDLAYTTIQKIMKSTRFYSENTLNPNMIEPKTVIPMIVVDGPLFEASFDNELKITEVNQGVVSLVKNHYDEMCWIMNKTAFEKNIAIIDRGMDKILEFASNTDKSELGKTWRYLWEKYHAPLGSGFA